MAYIGLVPEVVPGHHHALVHGSVVQDEGVAIAVDPCVPHLPDGVIRQVHGLVELLNQTPVCELVGLVHELGHEGHNLHQLYSLGGDHGVQETELCDEET